MIRISADTTYDEGFVQLEKYFNDDIKGSLIDKAQSLYGSYEDLTFARFWGCVEHNDYAFIGNINSVFAVYYIRGLVQFCERFSQIMKTLSIPSTAEEKQASVGLLPVSFFESALCFLCNYFNLHSFKEAENITLGEFLIAKKDSYNNERFKRNYSSIMNRKNKVKK